MGTINNSFNRLYQYIQSRKVIDNKHNDDIEELKDEVVRLDNKIDNNDVKFKVSYNLLEIKKGSD